MCILETMKNTGSVPARAVNLKAFLVVCFSEKSRTTRPWAEEIFEEMKALASTAEIGILNPPAAAGETPGIYRVRQVDPRYYLSSGIAQAVSDEAARLGADFILVALDLTPSQQANLAKLAKMPVRTKTEIIYEIFLKRSTSAVSKIQIELANLRYIKSRLTGSYEGMDRIRGGIGIKGPGETKLETDRRTIGRKIAALRDGLKRYARHFEQYYEGRADLATVSIVGYTNAGKSSLLNALTRSNEKAEDRLFSTVEVRTRTMFVDLGFSVLLSDTIGFIRDLPHHLVESFKTTLMDIRYAKLVLNVVDASSPFAEEHLRITGRILEELGCSAIPRLVVYNKIDRAGAGFRAAEPGALRLSTLTGEGIGELKARIADFFRASGFGKK
jgi:GTP-binding protein HflX